jgi:hypothetical protein
MLKVSIREAVYTPLLLFFNKVQTMSLTRLKWLSSLQEFVCQLFTIFFDELLGARGEIID